MTIPPVLQGTTWTKLTARNIFPLLVWCAQHGRTITYGHLDREIVRRNLGHHVFAAQYGYPAGTVGNGLIAVEEETGQVIPPLNALIVNKSSGIPGDGCDYYLKRYVHQDRIAHLTFNDRKAMSEQIHEDIFNFEDWDSILVRFGMTPIVDGIPPEYIEDTIEFEPPTGGWSSEGESDAHRALKEYVLNNPQLIFEQRKGWIGKKEFPLPSGDLVDVFFEGHGRRVAVEVKSIISNDNDLSRGLFQCVKYRAVTRAWQKVQQDIPNGNSVLVIQCKLPPALNDIAELLGIQVIVIDKIFTN